MHNQAIKYVFVVACSLLLTACNTGLFDKDNTPPPAQLVAFKPEIKPILLWSGRAGANASDDYLKMTPTLSGNALFTTSSKGIVTAVNKNNGHVIWRKDTHFPLTAGPGAGDSIVVVGSRKGGIVALQQADGKEIWRTSVRGEILAQPAVHRNTVIIKATDGYIRALSTTDGSERWSFQQAEPSLILRGSSAPLIRDGRLFVGFANGNLVKLDLNSGDVLWQQSIATAEGAFAIQRMIDIDADPIIYDHRIYAATYQGRITSLAWDSGRIQWAHDLSSYTGMSANNDSVYITDAKSTIWAFNANNGNVHWRQEKLYARNISGPAILGRYLIVGDAQGYLHWLDRSDGHVAAREALGSSIYAAPLAEDNILYVLTNSGYLAAYTINQR